MQTTNKTTQTTKKTTQATRIRELRLKQGMSATALAIASSVGLTEISLIERGAAGLGERRAARIAAALDVDPNELFA